MPPETTMEGRPALLPFDPADLVAMRVRPADFARMCQVSKQTVSQWIKKGLVTPGPDGLIDPAKAARQVMQNTNPARLRARVFKLAGASNDELRDRIRVLEAELAGVRDATLNAFMDTQAQLLSDLCDAITAAAGEIAELHAGGRVDAIADRLDEICGAIFWPESETVDTTGSAIPGASDASAAIFAREVAADAKQFNHPASTGNSLPGE